MYKYLIFAMVILFSSCDGDYIPKPKGALRLDYDTPVYQLYSDSECPYKFEINSIGVTHKKTNCDINIKYPEMKATLYISYKEVDNNIEKLLQDAQKLTYEHTIKADNIVANTFINKATSVYGTFYEVSGNAASQAQFYVTDSTHHFLAGSIYFHVKPNYDSIQPAAAYLESDLRNLMETLRWK